MPHFLYKIDGVALNVRTVERIDSDDRDLRVRLLFDLLADVIQLRDRGLIKDMGEVVNVIGGTQLRDRLSMKQKGKRQQDDERRSISQTDRIRA